VACSGREASGAALLNSLILSAVAMGVAYYLICNFSGASNNKPPASRNNNRRSRRTFKRRNMSGGAQTSRLRSNRPNPVPVTTDLRTTKRFEVLVSSTTPTSTVSPSALISTIPGGDTLWDRVQFHRFDIYGADTHRDAAVGEGLPSITVTLDNLTTGGYLGDIPTYYSDPVGEFRRAHVGISPNTAFQQMWVDSTSTATLLTLTTQSVSTTSAYRYLVQFTCTLRSTAGAPAEASEGKVAPVPRHC